MDDDDWTMLRLVRGFNCDKKILPYDKIIIVLSFIKMFTGFCVCFNFLITGIDSVFIAVVISLLYLTSLCVSFRRVCIFLPAIVMFISCLLGTQYDYDDFTTRLYIAGFAGFTDIIVSCLILSIGRSGFSGWTILRESDNYYNSPHDPNIYCVFEYRYLHFKVMLKDIDISDPLIKRSKIYSVNRDDADTGEYKRVRLMWLNFMLFNYRPMWHKLKSDYNN